MGDDSNKSSQQRADFEGTYIRSIENDQMNSLHSSDLIKLLKVGSTSILQLFLLSSYGSIMLGLFFLSDTLQGSSFFKE